MYLKNSFNWRKQSKDSTITYYNGEYNQLSSDNINALWSLLKILSKDFTNDMLTKWRKEFNYTIGEMEDIFKFLEDNGMIYKKTLLNSKNINKRNFNYFSIYDSSETADIIIKKINSAVVMILGVGTIGSTLAFTLANLGVKKIILVDYDIVEEKNIPAQFIFGKKDIGIKKNKIIKKKIEENFDDITIVDIDKQVNEAMDLEILLNKFKVSAIFNCFDTATEKLHHDIIDITTQKNIQYILMGYVYDSVIAFNMNKSDGHKIIRDSFRDYHESNVISENRGTILQSISSALIGTHLFLSTLLSEFGYGSNKEYITLNIKDMKFEEDESSEEKFIESLDDIYPINTDHFSVFLTNLKSEYYKTKENENKYLETEFISLYQFFQLLIEIDKLNYFEQSYKDFTEFLSEVDETSEEDTNHNYIDYLEIIDSIRFRETENIYSISNSFRDNYNYESKKFIQKEIYETIQNKAEQLLHILENEKKSQSDFYTKDLIEETLGISFLNMESFVNEIKTKYSNLFKSLYLKFFDTDSVVFDYLKSNTLGNPKIGDFNDVKSLILKGLSLENSQHRFLKHVQQQFLDNHLLIVDKEDQNNVNKTVFFPNVQQNRIVITYDGTYNSFFTVIHELGHSYYNLFYNPQTYFDDSNRILNETLALFTEFNYIFTLNNNKEALDDLDFEILNTQFIERISKLLLSNFAIYSLEEKVIDYINNSEKKLSLDSFLKLQNEVDQELFSSVKLLNSEYNQLNILLYPYFVFNFKDYLVDAIAVLLAAYLYQTYRNNPMTREHKLKDFFMLKNLGIEAFCEFMFNEKLNSNLIIKMINNFLLLVEELYTEDRQLKISV